jgi:stage II sporulation protein AA (anti-sigma F factor antagonist)
MSETHGGHWLEREDRGDVTLVRVKLPALTDEASTNDLFRQVYLLVDGMKRHKIVLNLAPVRYIGSMGLGKLVMLNRKTQSLGGKLVLCHLDPHVSEILDVTHLLDLIAHRSIEEQAVEALS